MEATVFCDGSCLGNPGPGGWGAIVRVAGQPDLEISGGRAETTNNRMELAGAYAGIRQAIKLGARDIHVVSDSQYLVKGMTEWVARWITKGWRTSKGPVQNRDAWEALLKLVNGANVTWEHIRGHNGHPDNDRCDELARFAAPKAPDW